MKTKIIAALALLLLIGASASVAQPITSKILIMGTSTTGGAGAAPVSNSYVELVKAARPNDTFTVIGRGGTTLVNADPAKSWENTVIPGGNDIVIMQFGINEWDQGLLSATFQQHATAFVARVRAANPDARLLWLSPWIKQYTITDSSVIDIRGNRWQLFGMAIDAALRPVQGFHIDLDPTGSRRIAVPYSSGEASGLHYNNTGHRKLADAVLAHI